MANIRRWLEEIETESGERIEAIVVGKHDNHAYQEPLIDENILLSREAGLAKLDQEYDNGYGRLDCYPMYAWTASRVYFVQEYDGATGISSVPRSPIACEPQFSGHSFSE